MSHSIKEAHGNTGNSRPAANDTKKRALPIRPYGLWESPLGPRLIAGRVRLSDVAWDDETGDLIWLRSHEGRGTLFASSLTGDAPRQLTTKLNIRGRIGYGGGEFTVAGGTVYFAADGGRLYRQSLHENDPRPITPSFGAAAAPAVSRDGKFVAYVHSENEVDRIAVVDSEGKRWPHILVEGDDFYMQPRWNPQGDLLAFVSWNFPHMPWDATSLHIGRFDAAAPGGPQLADVETVAGGDDVSVMQPEFSPDGRLLTYISDETGYWHIYAHDLHTRTRIQLTEGQFEHGVPAWVQGMRTYAFAPGGRELYYIRNEGGPHRLLCCTLYDGADNLQPTNREVAAGDDLAVMTQIAAPSSTAKPATKASRSGDSTPIALIASGPKVPPRIVVVHSQKDNTSQEPPRVHVVDRGQAANFIEGMISEPRRIKWKAADGTDVSGLYYAPTNANYAGPNGPPPAVVSVHSGPTSQSMPDFNAKAQFFTSRGYAYIEPNYRGSTGFGRAFRNMLRNNWGVVDVEDALGAATALVGKGLADEKRLVIMGSSAGGYTALQALCEHPGFFKAGLCMYGVADLFGLAMDTHKFERHYSDRLVGPLPEAADVYKARSPVFSAHNIRDAIAVFQGTDDPVVPKSQADAVVAALRRGGAPHEYYVYEGEGHGWSREETVVAVYEAIETFLQRHVIFA